jgi:mannose-6-phosphate isomerase
MSLYPLKFKPRFVEKMWGGRKIQTVLGKPLPPDKTIGESWELYDFPPGVVEESGDWVSSVVANGPLAGRTLHSLLEEFGRDLIGDVKPCVAGGRQQFPILIKFLDAREDLSVQVHPDCDYVERHPGACVKNEAWYVLQSDPGARILKGVRHGMTRDGFRRAVEAGEVEESVNTVRVKPGAAYYLPSGTVHALGAGTLVAEVQTPSDTTYRVFDFNRVDPSTGKQRTLHLDQALECINFSAEADAPQTRSHVAGYFTTVSRLVTAEQFKLEKVRMTEGVEETVPYDQPVVWIVLEGQAEVRAKGVAEPTRFGPGDTVLLPAAMKDPVIRTRSDCVWLEVTFPTEPEVG